MRRRSFSGRTDEQLGEEIAGLDGELRAFRREHEGKTRDDARASFARRREELRTGVEERLGRVGGDIRSLPPEPIRGTAGMGPSLTGLAALWAAACDDGFAAAVNKAIDAGAYSKLTAAAVAKEIGRLEQEIHDRRAELERRAADREVTEARERLAAAEAKLVGSTTRGGTT